MKNKIYTVIRIVLALIFIPSAFISFFMPPSEIGLSSEATTVVENLWASGYIMHVVKFIELMAGIMFLTNKFVRLACVLIMPIVINILLLAIFKDLSGLVLSIPMLAMVLFLVKENVAAYQLLLEKSA
ncbi:MAG: DoxX family membrane protein [Luteibaculaceae bacterium]